MATSRSRAVFELGLDDKQFQSGIKGIQQSSKRAETSLRGIGQALNIAIFRELATIGVGAVRAVATEIGELAARGAEVSALRGSFESLTGQLGLTSAAMLGELRGATQGLVSDMELMNATNKAILLDLPVTTESMGIMAETAAVLGRAMGQDAAKSLDDLTTALGRSSPLILDNLGLTVDTATANQTYATELGKTVKELSEAEKKTAFYNAAMEAARGKVAELGGLQLTFGDRLKGVQVDLINFRDRLSEAVAQSPALSGGLEAIAGGLTLAFGSNQQTAVQTVMGLITEAASAMTFIGQAAVVAAQVAVAAWNALKIAVLGAVQVLVTAPLQGIADLVAGLAVLGTKIPLIGEQVEGFAGGALALSGTLDQVNAGLRAQVTEAANAVAGGGALNAMLDGVNGTLINTREAMRGAAEGSLEASTAMRETARASGEAAAETLATSKQAAAEMKRQAEQRAREAAAAATLIQETERQLQQELALMNAEGLQRRLLELQFARDEELRGLETLRVGYGEQFAQLALMVNQKYDEMAANARAAHLSIEVAAREQGFKTRAELEQTAAKFQSTYQRMLESGKFTAATLREAWEQAEQAKRDAAGETEEFQLTTFDAISQGAIQIFGALGQKFKAAAIAGALIATYSAVAKALASAPWPANLIPAAGALAAGLANVARIRSAQAGFAQGTPGLDFADFGPVSLQALHAQEAVIPRGGGHLLAGEIAGAMPDDAQIDRLDRIATGIEALPATLKRAVRDGLLLTQ